MKVLDFIRRSILRMNAKQIRSSHDLDEALRHGYDRSSDTGEKVNAQSALALSSFYAGVRLIAETVAQIPMKLYQKNENGDREEIPDHRSARIFNDRPNTFQTPFEFVELMQQRLILYHNAYAYIQRPIDGDGELHLTPIHNDKVIVRSDTRTGVTTYDLEWEDMTQKDVPSSRVFHIRGMSDDGFVGKTLISYQLDALGGVAATERTGRSIMKNTARFAGFLRRDDMMTPEQVEEFRETFEQYTGQVNAGKIPSMPPGVEFVPIGMSNADAQLLDTRKWNVGEVARMLRIPNHMIGDLERATYDNIEEQGREFLTYTLMPWLVRWTQKCRQKLLPRADVVRRGTYFEHVTNSLVTSKIAERFEAYQKAMSWLSGNEIRKYENLPMIEGLDEPLIPLNMVPSGMAEEIIRKMAENKSEQPGGAAGAPSGSSGGK